MVCLRVYKECCSYHRLRQGSSSTVLGISCVLPVISPSCPLNAEPLHLLPLFILQVGHTNCSIWMEVRGQLAGVTYFLTTWALGIRLRVASLAASNVMYILSRLTHPSGRLWKYTFIKWTKARKTWRNCCFGNCDIGSYGAHSHSPSSWGAETRRLLLWIWGHPGLHSELLTSLGYRMRPYLEKKKCVWYLIRVPCVLNKNRDFIFLHLGTPPTSLHPLWFD